MALLSRCLRSLLIKQPQCFLYDNYIIAENVILFFREEELSHNVELTADLINPEVDLKFFPAAPVDKDVTNRVGISILNTAEDEP